MLVKTYGSAIVGVNALTVTVEVNVGDGVGFFMVGLPDNAVKESAQRISSAFEESGFRIPGRRVIVNLAPADLKKEGTAYDLTIAIGVLGAVGMVKADEMERYVIMGELGLDGTLRPIKGVLPIAIEARKQKYKGLIVPVQNVREAAVVNNLDVYGMESLMEVITFFNQGKNSTTRASSYRRRTPARRPSSTTSRSMAPPASRRWPTSSMAKAPLSRR